MFKSYYRLKITGRNPESFLRQLISWSYPLLDIERKKNSLFISVDENTYQKILERKSTYQIEVVNRYGKAKGKYLFQKYFYFVCAIFLSLILLKFMSMLLLKVEVIHTKEEIRQIVLSDLAEYGIQPYRLKVSFDKKEEIIKKILKKERDRIEWLEIEEVGTTYRVNVEERKRKTETKPTDAQSIIAKKAGRILEIDATRGEIVKKKNDYVQKGDIIVSGIIKNKEDPVSKVRAEAKVYAEVWYQVHLSIPYDYQELEKTGNQKRRFEIKFLNHSFSLFDFFPYSKSKKTRKILYKNPLIPLQLSYTTFEEVKVKKQIHHSSDAYLLALSLARQKLKAKLNPEDQIISQKTLKKSHKNSKIEVDIFFKVKEDITDTVSLKDIQLEDLKKEQEEEGE